MTADGIIAHCRTTGQRITRAKTAIIRILCAAACPVSAEDVMARLSRQKVRANKTTVYRELGRLSACGITAPVNFGDGKQRFEISTTDNHHHHLVCRACGIVRDIALAEAPILRQVETQTDFTVERHTLEFFGICAGCRNKSK